MLRPSRRAGAEFRSRAEHALNTPLVVSLSVYFVAMIGVGVWAGRRVENEADYLVAGRRLPLWLAWGTLLATWFGAATVMGASEAARDEGVPGTILDPFASGTALIVAGLFFARPLWEMQLLTMGDFFREKYGRRTELFSSTVQAIGYLPWIAAQYLALAAVAGQYFGVPFAWGVIGAAAFVLFLTMIGGMWSVTLTDTAQILLVLISLVVLGGTMLSHVGGVDRVWAATPPDHRTLLPQAGTAAVLIWAATWANGIFGNLPGQDLMQRVFASRSAVTAQRACVLAGVVYVTFGLLPVGLGLASRIVLPEEESPGILLKMADAFLSTPLQCVFVVALTAIIVSTCTSALLSPSALIAHNMLERSPVFASRRLFTNRLSTAAVTLCTLPFAFGGQSILDLLDVAIEVGLVALFVPFAAGLYGRPRSDTAGLCSISAGLVVWLGHRVAIAALPAGNAFETIPPELTGTAASLARYLAAQQFSRPDKQPQTPPDS
ncbi:MAG: sodium:solute symporter [Planctomycetota bacterium]|nr:MAG: sodium:solute symporter [Planctomycetota bacterium]